MSNPRRRQRTVKNDGPDPIDRHVGRQLRLARELAGLTQSEIAKLLGMSFQVVQKYEQGEIRVSASRLLRIAQTLGKPVTYLFDGLSVIEDTAAVQGRREAELIRAFRQIADTEVQQRLLALVKGMATPSEEAPPTEPSRDAARSPEAAPG